MLQSDGPYTTTRIREKFQLERAKFMTKMTEDYGGENVAVLFEQVVDGTKRSIARSALEGTTRSWNNVQRQVALKILELAPSRGHLCGRRVDIRHWPVTEICFMNPTRRPWRIVQVRPSWRR